MALGGLPTQAPAPAGPRPTPNRCACFDVYEPTALKRRPAIQGLEKLLFIQMWLTPHQFKPAVLIIIIMLIVLCFLVFCFSPNRQLPRARCPVCAGMDCTTEFLDRRRVLRKPPNRGGPPRHESHVWGLHYNSSQLSVFC